MDSVTPRRVPELVRCAGCRAPLGERTGQTIVSRRGGAGYLNPEAIVCPRCKKVWSNPYLSRRLPPAS